MADNTENENFVRDTIGYPKCEKKEARYHFNNSFLDSPLVCGNFNIYQIGEIYCLSGEVLSAHRQFCCEVTYVSSGSGKAVIGGEEKPLSSGSVIISLENEIHSMSSDVKDPLRYCYCAFSARNDEAGKYIDRLAQINRSPHITSLSEIFTLILTEITSTDEYRSEMLGAHIKRLLIEILRNGSEALQKTYNPDDKAMLVYNIGMYIDKNICTIKELRELENVFFFKYRYLEKVFLDVTGDTISHYYIFAKMEYAKRKLAQGFTVTQIGEALGYSSIYSFSRAFSNVCGMSPLAYKQIGVKATGKVPPTEK